MFLNLFPVKNTQTFKSPGLKYFRMNSLHLLTTLDNRASSEHSSRPAGEGRVQPLITLHAESWTCVWRWTVVCCYLSFVGAPARPRFGLLRSFPHFLGGLWSQQPGKHEHPISESLTWTHRWALTWQLDNSLQTSAVQECCCCWETWWEPTSWYNEHATARRWKETLSSVSVCFIAVFLLVCLWNNQEKSSYLSDLPTLSIRRSSIRVLIVSVSDWLAAAWHQVCVFTKGGSGSTSSFFWRTLHRCSQTRQLPLKPHLKAPQFIVNQIQIPKAVSALLHMKICSFSLLGDALNDSSSPCPGHYLSSCCPDTSRLLLSYKLHIFRVVCNFTESPLMFQLGLCWVGPDVVVLCPETEAPSWSRPPLTGRQADRQAGGQTVSMKVLRNNAADI